MSLFSSIFFILTVICFSKLSFWTVLFLFLCICFSPTVRKGHCYPLLQVRKLWLILRHRTREWFNIDAVGTMPFSEWTRSIEDFIQLSRAGTMPFCSSKLVKIIQDKKGTTFNLLKVPCPYSIQIMKSSWVLEHFSEGFGLGLCQLEWLHSAPLECLLLGLTVYYTALH